MSKDVAKKSDLREHITADYRTVHGLWSIVKAAIAAVFDTIWRDTSSNEYTNVYFQSGTASVTPGADTTVTFDVEYSVTPRIIPGVESTDQDATARFHTPTTSGFKLRVINHTSGSAVDVHWIAIGRKD